MKGKNALSFAGISYGYETLANKNPTKAHLTFHYSLWKFVVPPWKCRVCMQELFETDKC